MASRDRRARVPSGPASPIDGSAAARGSRLGQSRPSIGSANMNDKSHVSLEQHTCLVCMKSYGTGALLLDRRLRATLEHHTLTGWGLCPEHQKMNQEGFVALIECDPEKSHTPDSRGRLK